ncbi:MAG: type I DNA topoisomerase [Capsulimonadaceae bacterium]|nr:type I DNA topoisomerase [Capsulimonadaceae bacterium]
MAKSLIIVESPAKTKTLKGFLGSEYQIEASMGHIRDLPERKLAVEVENDFAPSYVIIPERKEVLAKLKAALAGVSDVFLASDPDREGEAISWHLAQALKIEHPKRIQFNEITRDAVRQALDSPREIDMNRVNAQQARRVLDRLVGYEISPLLWRKVKKGLSAGRVQSVAVRLITDREREIEAFKAVEYWSLTASLTPDAPKNKFDSALVEHLGKKIELTNEEQTNKVLRDLEGVAYNVLKVKRTEKRRSPAPPFITSTLQQEASRKLGFNARRTMRVAQQLYEGVEIPGEGSVGLITYMRTDSNRIAAEAQQAARAYIVEHYGREFVPDAAKQYKKGKDAQDAHEAIRPTHVDWHPDRVTAHMTPEQANLYRLIWQRFVASQMMQAVYDVVTVTISAGDYGFRATGSTIKFEGFLRVYSEGKDEVKVEDEDRPPLPPLTDGQLLKLLELTPKQHFTEPPPRFTEATLVKALEEKGIGRPSTYATIISTIQDRGYVELKEKRFFPTELGLVVTDLLVKHFPEVLDITFTAEMELRLDHVEEGDEDWVKVMREFYGPFHAIVEKAADEMERVKIEPKDAGQTCPNCGRPMVVRSSRFGEFVGCSGYPECKTIIRPEAAKVEVPCPKCGGEVTQKRSRKGTIFYGCANYPKCDFVAWGKPIGRDCPECGQPLIENTFRGRPSGIRCSNKECTHKESNRAKKSGDDDAAPPNDADAPSEELATV